MKKYLFLCLSFLVYSNVWSQHELPKLKSNALANEKPLESLSNRAYTVIIYGALGCSYSNYLIENLPSFDACENTEVVLILDNSIEEIRNAYDTIMHRFNIYSNKVLNHPFRKGNDITPQTFLYENDELKYFALGVKRKMFLRINKEIECL